MKKLFLSLLISLLLIAVASPAFGAYVLPDPGGRDGWIIDTATGNLVMMRAGTAVGTISTTGAQTITDLAVTDDLTVADDAAITGLMTVGETLGVTGITTLVALLNANGGIAVDTSNFTVNGTTGAVATASTLSATGDFTVNTNKFSVTASSGNTTIAGVATITGNVDVNTDKFNITASTGATAIAGAISGASTLTVVSQTVGIDFSTMRVYDAFASLLTNTAGDDDDLTFVMGTPGTTAPTLETIDCGALNDTTQYAAFFFVIPPTYLAGTTITLSMNVGMQTTIADQAATLDFSCWVPDYANEDTTVSGDLIETAAQSVNSTTFAVITFVLDDDATGYELAAGDTVQCQITALCDDDGDAAGGITIRLMYLHALYST